jgi:DNA-directed RNA polymerase specialized sigma24 family protein
VWEVHLRIEQAAKRWARGFDKDTTQEIIDGVQKRTIEIVLASLPSRQSDFLEVAFNQAVKRHTLNAVEKRRNAPLPLSAEQPGALDGEEDDAERPTERVEDESPQVEELVSILQNTARRGPLLRRAQATVKDIRHYQAILLHYGFGWPYASTTDPDKQSLQAFFGVSERQIRNWIRDGLEAIRTVLENTHDA